MAITVEEAHFSGELTAKDGDQQAHVIGDGATTTAEALAALKAWAAATWGALEVDTENVRVERVADQQWAGYVPYKGHPEPETGDVVYHFDTSGGTHHITQAEAHIEDYPPETAADHEGAIGVTHDGIEGVDIQVGAFAWTETHYIAAADITTAFLSGLAGLAWHVNDDTFVDAVGNSFDAGEVLHKYVEGGPREQGDWELQYHFEAEANRTGIMVGTIEDIAKLGWHYLWVKYAPVEDDVAKALIPRPLSVHIEQVYKTGDFDDLFPA